MNDFDVNNFEKETCLKIRYDYNSKKYIEISGKSYKQIKNKINSYNLNHNSNITCYDDFSKDCTYISVNM